MLIEQLKNDLLASRKARIKTDIACLTTFLGAAQAIEKKTGEILSNSKFIALVRNNIKTINENIKLKVPNAEHELKLLSSYLPEETSSSAISSFIDCTISDMENVSMKTMGVLMGALNKKFGDNLNKGTASSIVRNAIAMNQDK